MRAIVINAQDRTVIETDIDGSLIIPSTNRRRPDRAPSRTASTNNHHCYVNEEGLLDDPQHFFMLKDGHQPLAGNGIILSSTDNGDEAPCTLPLDWVKERLTFMDLVAARQWSRTQ